MELGFPLPSQRSRGSPQWAWVEWAGSLSCLRADWLFLLLKQPGHPKLGWPLGRCESAGPPKGSTGSSSTPMTRRHLRRLWGLRHRQRVWAGEDPAGKLRPEPMLPSLRLGCGWGQGGAFAVFSQLHPGFFPTEGSRAPPQLS